MDQMLFGQNEDFKDQTLVITNILPKASLVTCHPISLDLAFDFIKAPKLNIKS